MTSDSISLVVPTYNVATYLPAFLASLDEQAGGLEGIEIVFVNDGSTDDSLRLIEAWISRSPAHVRVITQPNGGLSAARNRGLDEATGDWVSFPDPDDMFSPNYFETVRAFLATDAANRAHLLCTNLTIYDDATGKTRKHPLHARFRSGQTVVDLERQPKFIHLQAASGFYRRSLIDQFELRFDERIRPNFEDAHLTALYLGEFEHPMVALLPAARYLYRQRADGSSLVQGSWARPEKFVNVPRYGHLDLLQRVAEKRGRVPVWAQNLVLYDLAFYFRADARPNSPTASLRSELTEQFHELLREILSHVDASTIKDFTVTWTSADIRAALLIGGKGAEPRPTRLHIDRIDRDRKLVRLQYYFAGALPDEEFRARGFRVTPVHAKTRDVSFLGRTMVRQRIVWLPATGTLAAGIDGVRLPVHAGPDSDEMFSIGPTRLWQELAESVPPPDASSWRRPPAHGLRPTLGRWKRKSLATVKRNRTKIASPDGRRGVAQRNEDRLTRSYARTVGRTKYRDAWLLIDRDSQAQDNAEHLYRYLKESQPQINAWFVLDRDSADWARLSDDGFRLIAHGSREHTAALMNCTQLISSQVDHYVVAPLSKGRFGPGNWRFTFLQHGVTHNDLSVWINRKPIDLMITTTSDEHESIVGNDSPYVFSDKEIKLTGFPRHDRLLRLATESTTPPRTLLVMPTWRRELLLDQLTGGNERALREDFWESDYAQNWRLILESPRLHEAMAQRGWEILFVPHPNMQGYLDDHPLPKTLRVARFRDIDIQQTLVAGGAMITDYSSLAFEMAYIERPVVYFQFDRAEFFSGAHAFRRGSWSYEDEGFGPVALDAEAAVDALVQVIEHDGAAEPEYAKRMAETFTYRDGECSRRTFEAISDIRRPLTYDELYLRSDA